MNGYDMTQGERRLPTRLGIQVLLEALFEIRFSPKQGAADLLPGILLHAFEEKPRVERLPLADVPQQVRLMQPDLAAQPVVRLVWSTHSIYIGDSLLGIACVLPYPGWKKFKDIIQNLMNNKMIHEVLNSPNRFSVKYVDFLPDSKFPGIQNKLNWQVNIAGESYTGNPITLRTEKSMDGYVCIMEVHSPAQVQLANASQNLTELGTIVSFDLIKNLQPNLNWEDFLKNFDADVEFLHQEGKKKFFDCLTPEVNEMLMPSFD